MQSSWIYNKKESFHYVRLDIYIKIIIIIAKTCLTESEAQVYRTAIQLILPVLYKKLGRGEVTELKS